MRLGTTPKHTFTFPFETSLIQELKITYSQNGKTVLEKHLVDCEIGDNFCSVTLTQEETFLFAGCVAIAIQARVLTVGGDALASDIYYVESGKCLDREVLA